MSYLESLGNSYTPQTAMEAPFVSLPPRDGWLAVPPEAVPSMHTVLAQPELASGGWTPNVILGVGELAKPMTREQLFTAAREDEGALPKWKRVQWDEADYLGYPSCRLVGTYQPEEQAFAAATRYVLVDAGPEEGPVQHYLVQATVSVFAEQLGELAGDIEAFVDGMEIGPAERLD
jgi:hypothetical protein